MERTHLTLQDRLVKELRLRDISTMEAANVFMAEFIADYNARFAKVPRNNHNAHRPLRSDENLDLIFASPSFEQWQAPTTIHFGRPRVNSQR